MPEYGRHVQEMVNYVKTIEDAEQRQKNAEAIIELMGLLNPHLKNIEQYKHMLWDHLFTIADFDLDVQSPYPIPSREDIFQKSEKIPYPKAGKTHRHLGKNILTLIEKACNEPEEDKKEAFTRLIAYYMKLAYNNWHKEMIHDEMIQDEIEILSNGALHYNIGDVRVKFFSNNNNNKSQNKKHHNQNRNNNQNRNQSNKNKKRNYR